MIRSRSFLIFFVFVVNLACDRKEKDEETTEETTEEDTATEDEGLKLYSSCQTDGTNSMTHALKVEDSKITRYEVLSIFVAKNPAFRSERR